MGIIKRKKILKAMRYIKRVHKSLLKFEAQTDAIKYDQQNALNALAGSYNAMIDFLMNF